MLNPRSFLEILSEVHSGNQTSTTENTATQKINAGWETLIEPSNLAFLMGRISPVRHVVKASRTAYPRKPRPSHILGEVETFAFENLRSNSPLLNDNFNLHELRSAYRRAVLKTHPDQGGTAESFQAVKKSYQILLAFVTK